ncbi:hypothetical protein [Wolbachia endosymbiont of Kerria lacca]
MVNTKALFLTELHKKTGCQWALLHHSRKEQAVTDGICYKIDI